MGIQPQGEGRQSWAWNCCPGSGEPAWGQGCTPRCGSQPRQWGAPAADIPDLAPPGREPTAVQPPRPSSCSHTSQCGGCLGAPVPQTISGGRTALQLCRQLFEGEQKEQRTHLRLAAGTEGRCPLMRQGQTSRTCLVSLLSPCSWPRQLSHTPQCSSSSPSPAPGNARGAGSWGLAQLLAPGPPEPWSPGCNMLGSAGPGSCCSFPACCLGSGTQHCGQEQGTTSPGRDLRKIAWKLQENGDFLSQPK